MLRRLTPLLLLLLVPAAALAQSGSDARLRDALRNVTGQLRALEDQHAKSQAHEEELKAENEKLRAELQTARAAAAKPRGRSNDEAALQRQLAARTAEAGKAAEALAACKSELDAQTAAGKTREQERARAAQAQSQCEASRQRLYGVAKEAVKELGENGPCEPVFGFGRVSRENRAQDYQDKLLEQLLAGAAAPRAK